MVDQLPPQDSSRSHVKGLAAHVNLRGLIAWALLAGAGLLIAHFKEQGLFAWFPQWGFDVGVIVLAIGGVLFVWTHPDVRRWRLLLYNHNRKIVYWLLLIVGSLVGAAFGRVGYWAIERQHKRQETSESPILRTTSTPTPSPSASPTSSASPGTSVTPSKQPKKSRPRDDTEEILLGRKKWPK